MATENKNDLKVPLIKERPIVNYTKRYDQVSWHSADTDFDPSSADEHSRLRYTGSKHSTAYCTKRKQKLLALAIVVCVFLAIMIGLIYLYLKKPVGKYEKATLVTLHDCGQVAGVIETVSNKQGGGTTQVYVYKGIPYAQPPVGKLRWKAPLALSKSSGTCWTGVFTANSYGSQCAHGISKLEGSENCLYLNVHTPTKLNENANLPVFVWIHGGYLTQLNGNVVGYSPDSEFTSTLNVVSVSMNYRLTAFGFLSLEELWVTNTSYGNYGFMDQILVLKWIQKNIKKFGGDPNSVTLCGQSSGGTSIYGLLASPLADGLFHRAIPISGSPKFERSHRDASVDNREFIRKSKCASLSGEKLKSCLYNLTAREVILSVPNYVYPYWNMSDLLDFPEKGIIDGPLAVIDPVVVPSPPRNLNAIKGLKNKVSILLGTTAQEIGIAPVHPFDNKTYNEFKSFLSKRLNKYSTKFADIVLGKLYVNKSLDLVEYMYETISSDVRMNCPNNILRIDFSKSANHIVYRYVLEHHPSISLSLFGYPAKYAFHMWDTIALFNFKFVDHLGYKPNKSDIQLRESLRKNFKHFMQYGLPLQPGWDSDKTGIFNKDGIIEILNGDYHEKQCAFWNNKSNGFVPYAWIN